MIHSVCRLRGWAAATALTITVALVAGCSTSGGDTLETALAPVEPGANALRPQAGVGETAPQGDDAVAAVIDGQQTASAAPRTQGDASSETAAEATAPAPRAAPKRSRSASRAFAYAAVRPPRFGDNDPYEWGMRRPSQYAVHGIDVARYQSNIDWAKARTNGVSFAFIKATEGGDHLDERFKVNWKGAKRAGVPRGAYHFFYFCRPAFEQARWFIRNVPRDASALPPVLDMEWNHKSPSCRFRPKPAAVRKEMNVWLKQVGRHFGRKPLIYTTVDFYADNQLWKIKGYDFWLRSVAGHPSEKYPGQDWRFWQYTGTGVVPGIRGNTDINVFHGSKREWAAWLDDNTG